MVINFEDISSDYSVIFEDDGIVAYAYLLENDKLVGDAWIYNHGNAPTTPDWSNPESMPFRNPQSFASKNVDSIVESLNDVSIVWIKNEEYGLISVEIHIKSQLSALLKPNVKPGWSKWATKDGPLAKSLSQLMES